LSSIADTVIIPLQDYMKLDDEARINKPSTLGNNWTWRLKNNYNKKYLIKKISEATLANNR